MGIEVATNKVNPLFVGADGPLGLTPDQKYAMPLDTRPATVDAGEMKNVEEPGRGTGLSASTLRILGVLVGLPGVLILAIGVASVFFGHPVEAILAIFLGGSMLAGGILLYGR